MKNYKLFIFDWDGTLVNTGASVVFSMKALAKALGLATPSDEIIGRAFGLPLVNMLHMIFPDESAEKLMPEFYKIYLASDQQSQPFEKVEETLQYLQEQDYLIAIATNKIRSALMETVERLNWKHYFSAYRCGDDQFVKPNPTVLFELLDELVVDKKDAVMIGDTKYDVLTAKEAQVDSVAICHNPATKEELISYQPSICVNNFAELSRLIVD